MKLFKNVTKQAFVLLISEVLFVGLLSFGVNKYIFRFMENWTWWQYSLLVLGTLILVLLTLLFIELFAKLSQSRNQKRRNKKMERAVEDLQLSVMQEFFKIRMQQAYGAEWTSNVKSVVRDRFDNNDQHRQNYQGIYDVLQHEGVETLDEKDMDITSLSALMLYDFFDQCKVGTNFRQQIRNIRIDKNELVSHIPNHNDILNVKILELTALKDIRSFLTYLGNSNWNYNDKQRFVAQYQEKVEQLTRDIFKGMAGENQEEVEFESNRRNYCVKLISERAENASEYIPLSYKVDDGSAKRYGLDELFDLPSNSKGFVIFSREAGYGKTWSIQELAGKCAESALGDNANFTPILLRMGELPVHEEPIMKAIQEALYLGDESIEKARKFIMQEKVVLFIDGMDEAAKENKEPAWRELKKLLSSSKNIRIVGGTRESDIQWYPDEIPKYSICELSDKQVEAFIDKLIPDEEQNKSAKFDYFENPRTGFLKNLRSPFYLKCFIDFVRVGGTSPDSDTDMMNRCINKMIEREISVKGFRATVQIVNEYLAKLSELIGNDRRYMPENEALKALRDNLMYDTENYASVAQMKDTLIEFQS